MPNTIASPIPTPPKIIFFDIDDTLYIKAENRILVNPTTINQPYTLQ